MLHHKYLTCTGYGGTGSSVVSDLMKEFDNVGGCGSDFEFTLAFDVDGISDLQHFVEDDFERNKVSEGIYRFIAHTKQIRRIYSKYIGNAYDKAIDDFLSSLIGVSWKGACVQHRYRFNRIGRVFLYRIPDLIQSVVYSLFFKKTGYEFTPMIKYKQQIQYPRTVEFSQLTKTLYTTLLDSFDPSFEKEYLCFDQLVPAYNYNRYIQYFPNLKVICVDRDPRDLYLLNKMYWKEGWIPSDKVDDFIIWYKLLRDKSDMSDSTNVLHVQFEDTIFNYEDTISKIIDFVGIDKAHHVKPKKFFNPNYSIKNVQLWKKPHPYGEDIKKIYKELNSYCFSYNK